MLLFTVLLTVLVVLELTVRQPRLVTRILLLLMVRLRRQCHHRYGFVNDVVPH